MLFIEDCQIIKEIPIVHRLKTLRVKNCQNVVTIPIIQGLEFLYINMCYNIIEIPLISSLLCIVIEDCRNIKEIPIIEGLQYLTIKNFQTDLILNNLNPSLYYFRIESCAYYYEYCDYNDYYTLKSSCKIQMFKNINKIKN